MLKPLVTILYSYSWTSLLLLTQLTTTSSSKTPLSRSLLLYSLLVLLLLIALHLHCHLQLYHLLCSFFFLSGSPRALSFDLSYSPPMASHTISVLADNIQIYLSTPQLTHQSYHTTQIFTSTHISMNVTPPPQTQSIQNRAHNISFPACQGVRCNPNLFNQRHHRDSNSLPGYLSLWLLFGLSFCYWLLFGLH